MILPIRTDSPLRHTPYVNWTLILLNVGMFIGQNTTPWIDVQFSLDPTDPTLLNFVSYQFLHGGVMHLLGNMVFLYIFGNNVNDKLGQLGYLAFYLAGGVFAGVVYILLGGDAPMIGASGSISAVTGAFLVLLPRTQVTILLFFILIGLFEVSSVWFILAFFVIDVLQQLQQSAGGGSGVAHTAHIGGTVFGVATMLLMLRTRLLPRDLFDVLALLDRWNRRRQHREAVNRGYDPFGFTVKESRPKPDPRLDQIQDLRAAINESVAHGKLALAAADYQKLLQVDPQQVLSRQTQLDIASELYTTGHHAAAAAAYEGYLRQYARGRESVEQVQLILGLIYTRYLGRHDRARELLTAALERLQTEREIGIAREELARMPWPAPREG